MSDDDEPRPEVTPGGTPRSVLGVVGRKMPNLNALAYEALQRGHDERDTTVAREWLAEQRDRGGR